MNQQKWTFVDDSSRTTEVGLLHGPESGHLVVHINNKVSVIDFEIKESKVYSLFINDQLCKIHIIKEGEGQYRYRFESDMEVDTPYNNQRKDIRRRHTLYTILVAVGFVAILFVLIRTFSVHDELWRKRNELSTYPVLMRAVVTDIPESGRNTSLRFTVLLGEGSFDESLHPSDIDKDQRLLLYLPFEVGDTIDLRASAKNLRLLEVYTARESPNFVSMKSRLLMQAKTPNAINLDCALDHAGLEEQLIGLAKVAAYMDGDPEIQKVGHKYIKGCLR